jgi:exopolysaccharide production protein ExoZ
MGTFGVDVFFVLSGFLMWAITKEGSSPAKFALRRAQRIVPLYWIATLLVFVGVSAGLFGKTVGSVEQLLKSLLFIPYYNQHGDIWPLLVPGWTLNYEMFFYAVFALLLLAPRQSQPIAVTGILAALVLAGLSFEPSGAAARFYTDPIILEFAAGMWLGVLWKANRLPILPGWSLAVIVLLSVVIAAWVSKVGAPGDLRPILYGIPATALVAAALSYAGRAYRSRPAEFLGDASYSIYLWHTIAISVAVKVGTMLGLSAWLLYVLGIVGGILAGMVSYVLIEKPVIAYFERRKERVALA